MVPILATILNDTIAIANASALERGRRYWEVHELFHELQKTLGLA